MRWIFFIVILLTSARSSFAQGKVTLTQEYKAHAARAYRYYEEKNYLQSALSYDTLFQQNGGTGTGADKYNAACSWALAGNKEKAFSYLTAAVGKGKWANLSHILSDSDLNLLHEDKRWQPIIETVTKNKETAEASLNKPLVALLDTVLKEDQASRVQIDTIQKQYGWKSKQMDSLLRVMNHYDSVNLVRVKSILDTYGWLGPDKVGREGSLTLFLVIQHADSATQVQYLPMMRQAVQEGKAQPQHLALLEDRVLTKQGKKQIYGSQLRTDPATGKSSFLPIEDEPNVNKRRAAIGLGPLEEYAKQFGVDYTLPKE